LEQALLGPQQSLASIDQEPFSMKKDHFFLFSNKVFILFKKDENSFTCDNQSNLYIQGFFVYVILKAFGWLAGCLLFNLCCNCEES